MRAREGIWEGEVLLRHIFEQAKPKSLVLLCISSLADAAAFVRENEALARNMGFDLEDLYRGA